MQIKFYILSAVVTHVNLFFIYFYILTASEFYPGITLWLFAFFRPCCVLMRPQSGFRSLISHVSCIYSVALITIILSLSHRALLLSYFLPECISVKKLKDSFLIMLQVSVLPPAAMRHYGF